MCVLCNLSIHIFISIVYFAVLEVPEPFYLEGPFEADNFKIGNISITGQSEIRLDHLLVSLEDLQVTRQVENFQINYLK